MTKFLELESTNDTPYVSLNSEGAVLWFKETSIPENAKVFYMPILEWVDEYVKNPSEETIVNFKMVYFNTSSTKYLFDIMVRLKDIAASKDKILIFNWYFHEDDNDMFEAGQNFSKMIGFPFNFVMYK